MLCYVDTDSMLFDAYLLLMLPPYTAVCHDAAFFAAMLLRWCSIWYYTLSAARHGACYFARCCYAPYADYAEAPGAYATLMLIFCHAIIVTQQIAAAIRTTRSVSHAMLILRAAAITPCCRHQPPYARRMPPYDSAMFFAIRHAATILMPLRWCCHYAVTYAIIATPRSPLLMPLFTTYTNHCSIRQYVGHTTEARRCRHGYELLLKRHTACMYARVAMFRYAYCRCLRLFSPLRHAAATLPCYYAMLPLLPYNSLRWYTCHAIRYWCCCRFRHYCCCCLRLFRCWYFRYAALLMPFSPRFHAAFRYAAHYWFLRHY